MFYGHIDIFSTVQQRHNILTTYKVANRQSFANFLLSVKMYLNLQPDTESSSLYVKFETVAFFIIDFTVPIELY